VVVGGDSEDVSGLAGQRMILPSRLRVRGGWMQEASGSEETPSHSRKALSPNRLAPRAGRNHRSPVWRRIHTSGPCRTTATRRTRRRADGTLPRRNRLSAPMVRRYLAHRSNPPPPIPIACLSPRLTRRLLLPEAVVGNSSRLPGAW
jgi:hypothetical protein